MKVAFVHDWLDTYRGGEKVLETLIELYPDAPIYTMFFNPQHMPASITSRKIIYPQWLQPFQKIRKTLLPLFPSIIESFDLRGYDLVISTSSCVAKGVITDPNTKHLCYLHSPMRYIWDQRFEYGQRLRKIPLISQLYEFVGSCLRNWDVNSAHRVDQFAVNSTFVKTRVKKFYGRDSEVIHPPIQLPQQPKPKAEVAEPYFLAAGALVGYKRFELAIEACQHLGRRLIIAGSGPAESKLRSLAKGSTTFVIAPNDDKLLELMTNAEALLFPGVEDFGMLPVEALACGTPIIAYEEGGALDYVIPHQTGLFFKQPSAAALADEVNRFDRAQFETQKLKDFAANFSRESFLSQIKIEIEKLTTGMTL